MSIDFFGVTERGRRERNEDTYLAERLGALSVFAVADGLGGHAAGDVASRLAVSTFRETLVQSASLRGPVAILQQAFTLANARIVAYNRERGLNAGSTLVAVILEPSGHCTIGTIGDSRAFIISVEDVWHTKDHSYVQTLVDRGVLSEDEAFAHPKKHIVEKALGLQESAAPDIYEKDLQDTTLVLSTDGLHDTLRPQRIAEIAARLSPRDAAAHLVREALRQQSTDNITVVVVRVT
ncbi:MAG: protein phosphatase 2C domain-containing protein [Methanomicrobiaceae archaeon]|nr:protein phosphatase 2C domain-containing protein [Methanomicrobiaceae archaeon]